MSNLVTDVKAVLRGKVGMSPYGSTSPRGISENSPHNSDEDITLLEAGERNLDLGDILYEYDPSMEFSDGEDEATIYLAAEGVDPAAQEREARRMEARYFESCYHPFYDFHFECGIEQCATKTRSEVYEVASSLGGRMRHMNFNKHQQFYGNLRIH